MSDRTSVMTTALSTWAPWELGESKHSALSPSLSITSVPSIVAGHLFMLMFLGESTLEPSRGLEDKKKDSDPTTGIKGQSC